jgi:hypothetical protein
VTAVIEHLHGVRFGRIQLWRVLGNLGLSPQKPDKRATERNQDTVRHCKRRTWPALEKNRQESRLIVLIDEPGISERPTEVRIWGLKGQTPIIEFHFNWGHVSAIAALSRTNGLFQLHQGSIRKE